MPRRRPRTRRNTGWWRNAKCSYAPHLDAVGDKVTDARSGWLINKRDAVYEPGVGWVSADWRDGTRDFDADANW